MVAETAELHYPASLPGFFRDVSENDFYMLSNFLLTMSDRLLSSS